MKRKESLDIWIDEIVPCLRDTATGEEKDTHVRKASRKELKGYNSKTGWYVNWHTMPLDVEIYALMVAGEDEIQGLIALANDVEANAVRLCWGCAAPHNNKQIVSEKKYDGVGGHLFAIAADLSVKWGYGGAMYGFASSVRLATHYEKTYEAERTGAAGGCHFIINEKKAQEIREVYSYEWK